MVVGKKWKLVLPPSPTLPPTSQPNLWLVHILFNNILTTFDLIFFY
jgi:hypothetical protein